MRTLLDEFVPPPTLVPAPPASYPMPLDVWRTEWVERLSAAAAVMGEPLSTLRYDEWAAGHGEVTSQSALLRGMLWVDVCEMAGVSALPHARGPRCDRVWTEERCVDTIGRFTEWALWNSRRASAGSYERWLEGRDEPAWQTIRLRCRGLMSRMIRQRTVDLLNEHFAEALTRLDAGEWVDPATYVGPLIEPAEDEL